MPANGANGQGNGNGNGHKPSLDLTALTGARLKQHETVLVPVSSLDELLAQVKRLGHNGSITIPINGGHPAGVAKFEREIK